MEYEIYFEIMEPKPWIEVPEIWLLRFTLGIMEPKLKGRTRFDARLTRILPAIVSAIFKCTSKVICWSLSKFAALCLAMRAMNYKVDRSSIDSSILFKAWSITCSSEIWSAYFPLFFLQFCPSVNLLLSLFDTD